MNKYIRQKGLKIFAIGGSIFAIMLSSCQSQAEETNNKDYGVMEANANPFNSTINSIVSTDVYGRSFSEGDVSTSDKKGCSGKNKK